jgi:hypothetical protein
MRLITLGEYLMGRDKAYPQDYTEQIAQNAQATVARINEFLRHTGFDGHVNSGWRPPALNLAAHGSPHSKHVLALACDLGDHDEAIDNYCSAHPEILESMNLWRESPARTPHWCHLQIVQYGSWTPGKTRTFDP